MSDNTFKSTGSADDMRSAVTFRSEGGVYAFGIETLTEILPMMEVTKIPGLPPHILGVINLRGEVIPVIDLRRRLGFEEGEVTGRETFMIISVGGTTAAVKTDGVETSVSYTRDNYMPFDEKSIAAGIIIDGSERITLIDAERLIGFKA